MSQKSRAGGGTPSMSSSSFLGTWPMTGMILFLFRAVTRFHLGEEISFVAEAKDLTLVVAVEAAAAAAADWSVFALVDVN